MKKIVLMGRSECGKTTLTQALKGEKIRYHKTQYVNNFDVIIDTPGEYAQTKHLGYALALYSYEADVVGLLPLIHRTVLPVPAVYYLYGQPGCGRHRDKNRRSGSGSGAGGPVASADWLQKALFCQFQNRGGRSRHFGIFAGGRRCDAVGAVPGYQKQ